jgi:hypothetical protein
MFFSYFDCTGYALADLKPGRDTQVLMARLGVADCGRGLAPDS